MNKTTVTMTELTSDDKDLVIEVIKLFTRILSYIDLLESRIETLQDEIAARHSRDQEDYRYV